MHPEEAIGGLVEFSLRVGGQALGTASNAGVASITVEQSLDVPSTFTVELHEVGDAFDADKPFPIGAEIEITLGYFGMPPPPPLLIGDITSLELAIETYNLSRFIVRGYDVRHRLQRGRKIRTFTKVKDSDVASRIASEAGLSAQVTSTRLVHEYLMQANQTDLDFLMQRARQSDQELLVVGKTLHVRPVADQAKVVHVLTMGEGALIDFRARLNAAGQVTATSVRGWDAERKKAIVGFAKGSASSSMGETGAAAVARSVGAGTELFVDQPVTSVEEADQIALARLDRLAWPLMNAEVTCVGLADLGVGGLVQIDGVGARFSGPYYVTSTRHHMAEGNYTTHFTAWRNAT